ncbi:MAG: hypothetical protein EMLJLAPB_00752 [Candidatus Argoarchaeum ethanivorans]|uniref:Uncharacterized protein n=1 Tax=Candidatus Argoarchaeum ethanivorans TaxID=2608793 RepID=A0A811THN2_9EURY|nr:MAG: hypothetical protein EMLJLAPB_00752 [Candidatus Argoarchaeum ethanivorans]
MSSVEFGLCLVKRDWGRLVSPPNDNICFPVGMIFYRYLAWKCKHLRLNITRLVDELGGIRLALVQEKTGGNVEMVVEEMDAKQARLFSLLDLGKFM